MEKIRAMMIQQLKDGEMYSGAGLIGGSAVKKAKSMKKPKAKAAPKKKKAAGANPWIAHVKKVAAAKGISYKDALKVASKTYKKK